MERRSESIAALAKALSAAQGEMQFAAKDTANLFFKSKYADLASVIEAAKPHLAKHGLSVSQSPDFRCFPSVDGSSVWLWVLESTLLHESGEWISSIYPLTPIKSDPQGFGSCLTYARRYSFMALVGIAAASDDDDGNKASEKPGKQPPTKVTAPVDDHLSAAKLDQGSAKRPVIPENPWLWKFQGESEHRGKPIAALPDDKIEALKEPAFRKSLVKTRMLSKDDDAAITECLRNMDALIEARSQILETEDYNGRIEGE